MNAERKHVVIPILRRYEKKANWVSYMPSNPSGETGWDLELRRKNLYLCIEAKYITRSFISSFSQLATSPLTKKKLHLMKVETSSACARPCWAIGSSYQTRHVYQILFDYLVRNLDFWKHYSEDLKMQYVFFIKKKKISRISFKRLLQLADTYHEKTPLKNTTERRVIADQLMRRYALPME